ncbi:hypothetical protein C8R45DRAFT_1165419 [Mycena sanguinolenta]|nr:hypothetical protein C8R45DRAFT_1165419 [Mycena sanguinolenta]
MASLFSTLPDDDIFSLRFASVLMGVFPSRDTIDRFRSAHARACSRFGANAAGETLGATQTGSMEYNRYSLVRRPPFTATCASGRHPHGRVISAFPTRERHLDSSIRPTFAASWTFTYSYLFAELPIYLKCDFALGRWNSTNGCTRARYYLVLLVDMKGRFQRAGRGSQRHEGSLQFISTGSTCACGGWVARHSSVRSDTRFVVEAPEIVELSRRKTLHFYVAEDVSLWVGVLDVIRRYMYTRRRGSDTASVRSQSPLVARDRRALSLVARREVWVRALSRLDELYRKRVNGAVFAARDIVCGVKDMWILKSGRILRRKQR